MDSTTRQLSLKVKDVDPITFQLYMRWVYSGQIDLSVITFTCECPPNKQLSHNEDCNGDTPILLLTRLYIAGDLLEDTKLQDTTIDRILEIEQGTELAVVLSVVDHVWTNTSGRCPLRRCILDIISAKIGTWGLPGNFGHYNPQFLFEIYAHELNSRVSRRRSLRELYEERSRYHQNKAARPKVTEVVVDAETQASQQHKRKRVSGNHAGRR